MCTCFLSDSLLSAYVSDTHCLVGSWSVLTCGWPVFCGMVVALVDIGTAQKWYLEKAQSMETSLRSKEYSLHGNLTVTDYRKEIIYKPEEVQ